jgi:hypothetical protein
MWEKNIHYINTNTFINIRREKKQEHDFKQTFASQKF